MDSSESLEWCPPGRRRRRRRKRKERPWNSHMQAATTEMREKGIRNGMDRQGRMDREN